MSESDSAAILFDLIRIPSHDREDGVAAYLAQRYDALRIPYAVTDIGGEGRQNITATWGEGRPTLLFNSHMDTVPPGDPGLWSHPPLDPRLEDGRLYGRGACDAKGPLAAMVAALERMVRSGKTPHGRVVLMAVGAEETAGLGTQVEVETGIQADGAVIGEPTDLDVCICHKGVLRLKIRTSGRAVHASEPWNGENAVVRMAPVLQAMDLLAEGVSGNRHPLLGRASLAVTMIRGGVARNVVPASCEISLDRRLLPAENPGAAESEILEAIAGLQATVERELIAQAAQTPPDAPIVKAALQAREDILGAPGQPAGFTACCDMRFLANQAGIPSIILGPGSLSQAHNADEYVELTQLDQASRIYETLMRQIPGGQSMVSPTIT